MRLERVMNPVITLPLAPSPVWQDKISCNSRLLKLSDNPTLHVKANFRDSRKLTSHPGQLRKNSCGRAVPVNNPGRHFDRPSYRQAP